MKKITCYKTEDRKLFESKDEALLHEKKEVIRGLLTMTLRACIKDEDLIKAIDATPVYSKYDIDKSAMVDYLCDVMTKDFIAFKDIFAEELL